MQRKKAVTFNVVCYMCRVLMRQKFPNLKQICPKEDNKCYLDIPWP